MGQLRRLAGRLADFDGLKRAGRQDASSLNQNFSSGCVLLL
jgi:hypothetical protein